MQVGVGRGPGDFLPNNGCQLAMMKNPRIELFLARVHRSFMKRNVDFDWGCNPAPRPILFVLPAILLIQALATLSAQPGVYKSPIVACNILWAKVWMSNYFEEILEARLRFLFTVIPIPFS